MVAEHGSDPGPCFRRAHYEVLTFEVDSSEVGDFDYDFARNWALAFFTLVPGWFLSYPLFLEIIDLVLPD